MNRPVILMVAAGALVFAMFAAVAVVFTENQHQRRASCKATTTALALIREDAEAGIRPVRLEIPVGISPELAVSFRVQLAATVAENRKRRAVIVAVDRSIIHLQTSHFCR